MSRLRQRIDSATLEQLAQLCRQGGCSRQPGVASGYAELDASLPWGGWPSGAVTELLSDTAGIGELSLFLPAFSRLARSGRYIAWIAPPYLPYAPALVQRGLLLERVLVVQTCSSQDSLWATEQALRCPAIGAVLSWSAHIVDRSLRRLQLAAEAGGSLGILHRPAAAAREPSPVALRLRLHATGEGLMLEIQKARGGRGGLKLYMRGTDALALHSSASAAA